MESDAVLNGEQLGSLSELVDSVPTNNTKANIAGFNIASHLQQRVERSDGSSSPEIDRLLQDIDAVLQPPSPDSSLARKGEGEGVGSSRQPSAPESLRSSHKPKRPKVAANFSGTSSVGAVSGSSRGDDGLDDTAQKTGDFKQSNILRTTGPDPTPSQAHSKQTNLTETITDQPATSPIPDSHISKPHSPDSARQHAAAAQIQHWCRDGKQQRLAEVQRVLQDKREELNRSRTQEMHRMQTEVCSLIPKLHSALFFYRIWHGKIKLYSSGALNRLLLCSDWSPGGDSPAPGPGAAAASSRQDAGRPQDGH